jgi:outer membrane protein TolC
MIERTTSSPPLRWVFRRGALRSTAALSATLALILISGVPLAANAQISLSTAVDLALRSNPKIRSADDDVRKARAQLSEVHDAYVPVITAGGGIGQAYGYSPDPPRLANVSGGSLVFSASQADYIRSARSGLKAALLAREDAGEAIAEDTALAFVAFDHDQQREQAIDQQAAFANSLVTIVEQRLDAGQDTQIDLTETQLTAAQLRLADMKAHDDSEYDREHLARLIDLAAASVNIDGAYPAAALPSDSLQNASSNSYANAGVAAAFANAQARQRQAFGLARFRLWPEINLIAQYNRYATFTESFAQLEKIDTILVNGLPKTALTANEGGFGIEISLPILDKGRSAKAREAEAEAAKAFHDAQAAQIDAVDGASRIRHNLRELQAQSDIAALLQKLAQQQLDVIQQQLTSGNGDAGAPQMSPKDQQKARIAERDKYLAVLDAQFQIRQAEIQLLRQTGDLESWIKSSVAIAPAATAAAQP